MTQIIDKSSKATTIVVANEKGGVGKTTIAHLLAIALTALGYKVVVVDMDSQGNMSYALDLLNEKGMPRDGILNLITFDQPLDQVLVEFPTDRLDGIFNSKYALEAPDQMGTLHLLPGHKQTTLAALDIQLKGHDFKMLQKKLAGALQAADFIIIDTQPAVSLWTPAIFAMSDYLIVPTQAAQWSSDGVNDIMTTLKNQRESGLATTQLLGVQPVMVRTNTVEHSEQLARMERDFGAYLWSSITQGVIWEEAATFGESVLSYDPTSKAAQQGWQFVRTFIQKIGEQLYA
jgi:chromosome partitioning protein